MDSLNNQQVQAIIAELDQALYSHEQWYKNLQGVLISHAASKRSDLMNDARLHCSFGQWYSSPHLLFLKQNPLFISLGKAHEKMHRKAVHLIRRISDGLPILVRDWDPFDDSIERMRGKIQALQDEFTAIVDNRDPLTESQTRATLLTELCEQQALVQRGKQVCVIAMVDLDNFKRINNEYGHAAGDVVLISTVKRLKSHLRSYDRIYRYGGEEFIICMPSTTVKNSCEVIEHMRAAVAGQHFDFGNTHVTASFGASVLRGSRTVEESIHCADKAMYKAKTAGKNRVVLHA
jgi:diguanylate cyclase